MSSINPSDIDYTFHSRRDFPYTKKTETLTIKTKNLPDIVAEIRSDVSGRGLVLHEWRKIKVNNRPYLIKVADLQKHNLSVPR